MARSTKVPSYRLHKRSGQAVVTLQGRDVYLGPWNSPESRDAYRRAIGEWSTSGAPPRPQAALTVNELILAHWRYAKDHYRKNGAPTSEQHVIHSALRFVRRLYGDHPVSAFGPVALKTCRAEMIGAKLSRNTINQLVGCLRRMFRWGVENELVPSAVFHGLQAVAGLQKGRSDARETAPVGPVSEEHVKAILLHVSPQVAAMVQLQLLTGMRPGEVLQMRACDLNCTEGAWTYTPASHKTEHHEKTRAVLLGPRAQEIVRRWLKPELSAFLFCPREAQELRNQERRENRKSPMTPSQARRGRLQGPRWEPGGCYTNESYRRSIVRACDKAGVAQWHPNQLRHTAATRFRKHYGIETTRALLGHSSAVTSEIYAEIDQEKARRVMNEVG